MGEAARTEKYERFQKLHAQKQAFVIPNPWDARSTRILTALGFDALATPSAGLAFLVGRRDSSAALSREEVLANVRAIVAATHLPVSADLEGGFGGAPEICARTIELAAESGLVGGRSRMSAGTATIRFLNSSMPWTGFRQLRRPPAPCRFC